MGQTGIFHRMKYLLLKSVAILAVSLLVCFQAKADEGTTPTKEELAQRNRFAIIGGELLVGWYGATHWWKDGLSGDFQTVDEGWFGRDTYTGGADKLGHLFTGYAGTRLLAHGFERLGNPPDKALWLGATTTLGTLMAIETLDGFSPRWRFSYGDMIMNIAGTALGVYLEKSPRLDAVLDFRLLYWPSSQARQQGTFDPIGDHSGQTFLLVAKASGVPSLRSHSVFRYLELAVGYGTRGYGDGATAQPSRNAYVGLSLNLAELLDSTVFSDDRNSESARAARTALEFFQVPGTAVAIGHHSF